jgi:hypothetical protein
MRNMLAVAALALLIFVGAGWYLGWYKVQSTPAADGHRHIEIDVDTNKIKSDVGKEENKLHDLLNGTSGTQSSTVPRPGAAPTSFRTTEDGTIVFSGQGAPAGGSPTSPPSR